MPPSDTEAASGAANAAVLTREIDWFSSVIGDRLTQYFGEGEAAFAIEPPPDLQGESGAYADMARALAMTVDERIVVMLALMPHLRPQVLDPFRVVSEMDQPFTQFGAWNGALHGGFHPTCETAAFILAGDDLARRFTVLAMFGDSHVFWQHRLFNREAAPAGAVPGARPLLLNANFLRRLTAA